MKIIDKYLIFEWLKWFTLCFLALYSLLFIQFLNEEKKLLSVDGIMPILSLFAYKALTYLTWLIPIVCFVSTLFTFSFLAKNRELLALVSTGFSTFLISRPIVIMGLICCLSSWLLQDTKRIVAFSAARINGYDEDNKLNFRSFKMRLKSVNRTWYFVNYDTLNGFAEQIHLYCYDDDGNDIYRIRAQSGQKTKNGWKFNKGTFWGFFSDKGIPIISENNKFYWDSAKGNMLHPENVNVPRYQKEFDQILLPNIHDDPKPFALLRVSPGNLKYGELTEIMECFPNPDSPKLYPYQLRLSQLVLNIPSCLVYVFFALGLTLRREQMSIGSVIGSSLIWILIFYVIKSFCDTLGEAGIISAWIVTLIPLCVILLASISMLWKNR